MRTIRASEIGAVPVLPPRLVVPEPGGEIGKPGRAGRRERAAPPARPAGADRRAAALAGLRPAPGCRPPAGGLPHRQAAVVSASIASSRYPPAMILPVRCRPARAPGRILFWQSARQRQATGLPGGRVIYTDTRAWGPVEKPLYDARTGPDRQARLPGRARDGRRHPGGGQNRPDPAGSARHAHLPAGGLLPAGGADLGQPPAVRHPALPQTAPSRSITPPSWSRPCWTCWTRCAGTSAAAKSTARTRSPPAAPAAATAPPAISASRSVPLIAGIISPICPIQILHPTASPLPPTPACRKPIAESREVAAFLTAQGVKTIEGSLYDDALRSRLQAG